MRQGELKAVLAHEYGHFANRDTAGGGFALAVRRAVLEMARTLAEGGAATWYNPAPARRTGSPGSPGSRPPRSRTTPRRRGISSRTGKRSSA